MTLWAALLQMVGSKSWVHRGLVVLQVWLLVQSVLISADKPQDNADNVSHLNPEACQAMLVHMETWWIQSECLLSTSRVRDSRVIRFCFPAAVTEDDVCFQSAGLHYDRYIRQVGEYLEKDPHFRAKLKNASKEDIEVKCGCRLSNTSYCKLFVHPVDTRLAAGKTEQRAELCAPQHPVQTGWA